MTDVDLRFHYEEVLSVKRRLAAWVVEQEKTEEGEGVQPYSITAHVEGQYAGGLTGKTAWGCLHIGMLLVEEGFRGKNVGSALVESALSFGMEAGCQFAVVETFDGELAAFYKRLGFEEEFRREGYVGSKVYQYLRQNLV